MTSSGDPYRSRPREFRAGELLGEMREFRRRHFTRLIRMPPSEWNSLDVDYEPPRVERLWYQLDDYRVSLHRIHPCERALFHPHPWAAVIWMVKGLCEMAVGYEDPEGLGKPPPEGVVGGFRVAEAARFQLGAGSDYEMVDQRAWHFVRPIEEPTLSVMLTWPPFDHQVYSHDSFGKKQSLSPLSDEAKESLLGEFVYQFLVP